MKQLLLHLMIAYLTEFRRRIPAAMARKIDGNIKVCVDSDPTIKVIVAEARRVSNAKKQKDRRTPPIRSLARAKLNSKTGTLVIPWDGKHLQHTPCGDRRQSKAAAAKKTNSSG